MLLICKVPITEATIVTKALLMVTLLAGAAAMKATMTETLINR
jgi:hypothetical protein